MNPEGLAEGILQKYECFIKKSINVTDNQKPISE